MSVAIRTRKLLIRAAVIAVLVLLAVFLYTIGRGYVLLLDNKAMEAGGGTLPALETVRVQVDGHEPIELYPRDRDQATVTGAVHRLTVTVFDRGGRELETRRVRFRIPGNGRMYLISLPALVGGAGEWISEFIPAENQAPPDREEAPETPAPEEAPPVQ
jgi:hypothetical protein